MGLVADNYLRLVERIRRAALAAGRDPDGIRLIGISKTVPAETVREAVAAGLHLFGENRAQELQVKSVALADLAIEWHFVGHLQGNKVRHVVPTCSWIHSVDSEDLARRIHERAAPSQPQPILVQVNTSGETTKFGVAPQELPALLDSIARYPNLVVVGLTTIGPLGADPERIRTAFALLRGQRDHERAAGRPRAPLEHLSMGMSDDFEIAIREGATALRIGRALFGPRPADG